MTMRDESVESGEWSRGPQALWERVGPTWRGELGPTFRLAGPVVLAELGWMAMGVVDTLMVGRLGAEAIGAVGLGAILFFSASVFGMGLLMGLDTVVSQAFGAGRVRECHRWMWHGLFLSVLLTPVLTLLLLLGVLPLLSSWGAEPGVQRLMVPYFQITTGSLFPLLVYTTLRRYVQGMGLVKPITFALVSANLVNVTVNWLLIFGNLGAPALGVAGAAWATVVSRSYMALVLVGAAVLHDRRHRLGLCTTWPSWEWSRLKRLLALGWPAAVQFTLEVGVFAAATALVSRLDATSLAAHHIALHACSVTFMVPLGISAAGAVRVGQAIGREELEGAGRAGWMALWLGAGFMACAAVLFVFVPGSIIRLFTPDPHVISTGIMLLWVAAVFQLFDGIQVVVTGVLRGAGDTRTPMYCNLVGHWLLGLPIGYAFGFLWGWGVVGLWIGLSAGLIVVGVVLLHAWMWKVGRWSQSLGQPTP